MVFKKKQSNKTKPKHFFHMFLAVVLRCDVIVSRWVSWVMRRVSTVQH